MRLPFFSFVGSALKSLPALFLASPSTALAKRRRGAVLLQQKASVALVAVCAGYALVIFHRTALSEIAPLLGSKLGLSEGRLGWIGASFLLVYLLTWILVNGRAWRSTLESEMKSSLVLAVTCSLSCVAVAQPIWLDYAALKTEARRVEPLESKSQRVSNKISFQLVRLDLSAFDAAGRVFFVERNDGVAFTCKNGLPKNFVAGWVTARVEKREPDGSGGTAHGLSGCKPDTR